MSTFLAKLQGYRTIGVGVMLVAYAIFGAIWGELPDPNGEQALGVSGFLMVLLRFFTKGPPGKTG